MTVVGDTFALQVVVHNSNVTNITDRKAYSNIIFRDQL